MRTKADMNFPMRGCAFRTAKCEGDHSRRAKSGNAGGRPRDLAGLRELARLRRHNNQLSC
jgi:hypothetical protein